MTTDKTALAPCPFCGCPEPHLVTNKHAGMSWVACIVCGLEAPSETGVSAEDAVRYWNERASPAPSASMGRVREALLAARDLAKTMEGLTGCRSDDDYVWGAQAKIEAAIASLPTQEEGT